MPNIRFKFVVSVNQDGSVIIDPSISDEEKDTIERQATAIDIIDASRKLVADLERQMIFDAMNSVLQAVTPEPSVSVPEAVKEALKERGITPTE